MPFNAELLTVAYLPNCSIIRDRHFHWCKILQRPELTLIDNPVFIEIYFYRDISISIFVQTSIDISTCLLARISLGSHLNVNIAIIDYL